MNRNESKYWTAFYTMPRNEKKVAQRLSEQGFHVYCPTRAIVKQWSDRKKKIKEPIFTSYIFAKVDEEERRQILKDSGIFSSVFWLKKPVRIPQGEIDNIKDFLSKNSNRDIQIQSKIGDEAIIKHGLLKGEKGLIKEIRDNKLILNMDTLGISIIAEIPICYLNE